MAAKPRCRPERWTRRHFYGTLPLISHAQKQKAFHERRSRSTDYRLWHGQHGAHDRLGAGRCASLPVILADAPQAETADRETPEISKNPQMADWQSVLALSPAAKTMLETLGVWQKLDRPSAPVCDMAVFGDTAAFAAGLGLDFAKPAKDDNAVAVLAHIICRAALDRAIENACHSAVTAGRIKRQATPSRLLTKPPAKRNLPMAAI